MRLAPVTSAETVAWGRAVAWRHHHCKSAAEISTFYSRCACQGGKCKNCAAGRHHACTHEHHEPDVPLAAYLTGRRGDASALGAVFLVCHLRLVQLCGDCLCQLRQDLLLHLKLQGGRHPHNERLLERDDTLKQRERR